MGAASHDLIAEEVDEVYPDLVARSSDGQIAVKYQVLDSMLLNEVMGRLKEQNESFQERLARMEAALASGAH